MAIPIYFIILCLTVNAYANITFHEYDGKDFITAAPRISGGNDAPEGKYPYMVSLRDHNDKYFCGGSIINKRWILSSGSCLVGSGHFSVTVVAGTTMFQGGNEQLYQSEYIVHHEDFDNLHPNQNNIALLRVSKDIEFNDKVQPVALPQKEFYQDGDSVVLTGWGARELGLYSDKLQEIELKLHNQEKCKMEMKDIANVTDDQICTLSERGKGPCFYDLGGPLVANGFQVGIISVVKSYCSYKNGETEVYTRVFPFLDWIHVKQAKFQDN